MKKWLFICLGIFTVLTCGVQAAQADSFDSGTAANISCSELLEPGYLPVPIPNSALNEIFRVVRDAYGISMGDLMSQYNTGICTVREIFNPAVNTHGHTYVVCLPGHQDLIVILGDL